MYGGDLDAASLTGSDVFCETVGYKGWDSSADYLRMKEIGVDLLGKLDKSSVRIYVSFII